MQTTLPDASRPVHPDLGRVLALCGLAAPISFTLGVVLAASRYPGYRHLTQAISELAAVGSPSPSTQTVNFLVGGALTLAFALGLGREPGLRRGGALFAGFGAMMTAHGFLPCDAGCGFVTPVGTAHNVLGIFGFLAAIGAIGVCARRAEAGAYRTYSFASAILAAGTFVAWIGLAKGAELAAANGSLQRVFVGTLLAWMFVTSWRRLRGGVA